MANGRQSGSGNGSGQSAWLTRLRPPQWLVRDGVLALLVGAVLLAAQLNFERLQSNREERLEDRRFERAERLENVRANRAERLENLRFVRERSSDAVTDRPFAAIDLVDMNLDGLKLRGANFTEALLRNARLRVADLRDTRFEDTDLRNADLSGADLTRALLLNPSLEDAELGAAFLGDAALIDVDLSRARGLVGHQLAEIDCYENTRWPTGMKAPRTASSTCEEWLGQ